MTKRMQTLYEDTRISLYKNEEEEMRFTYATENKQSI